MIPKHSLLLLAGVPATGKSEFANYLKIRHGFAHYDLEHFPGGWPRQELKEVWDRDRAAFVRCLRQHHQRVVLDWGFPVAALGWVRELRENGFELAWFDGNPARAREKFQERGCIVEERFNEQIKAIQEADFPEVLNCKVITTLPSSGIFVEPHLIESMIFQGL